MAAVKTRKTKPDKGSELVLSVVAEPNVLAGGAREWRATDLAMRAAAKFDRPCSREQVGGTLRLQLVPKGLAESRRVGRRETVWRLTEKARRRAARRTPRLSDASLQGLQLRLSGACCWTPRRSCRSCLGPLTPPPPRVVDSACRDTALQVQRPASRRGATLAAHMLRCCALYNPSLVLACLAPLACRQRTRNTTRTVEEEGVESNATVVRAFCSMPVVFCLEIQLQNEVSAPCSSACSVRAPPLRHGASAA